MDLLFFARQLGPPAYARKATHKDLAKYKGVLPKALLDLWKHDGFGAYANGRLWIGNPADYVGIVADWGPRSAHVIARNCFGDLLLVVKRAVSILRVHEGTLSALHDDVVSFLDVGVAQNAFNQNEALLRLALCAKAEKRLGKLGEDECFGFEPALALGGTAKIGAVRRLRLFEHLDILKQLHGG